MRCAWARRAFHGRRRMWLNVTEKGLFVQKVSATIPLIDRAPSKRFLLALQSRREYCPLAIDQVRLHPSLVLTREAVSTGMSSPLISKKLFKTSQRYSKRLHDRLGDQKSLGETIVSNLPSAVRTDRVIVNWRRGELRGFVQTNILYRSDHCRPRSWSHFQDCRDVVPSDCSF